MSGFSFSEAFVSGFKVVGRNPLAVVAWGLVYLLFVSAPALAYLAYSLPQTLEAMRAAVGSAGAGPPDPARLAAIRSHGAGVQPLLWLLSVAVNSVIVSAVFRAVLEPEAKGWAFLRLGAQELWTGLTYLVLLVASVVLTVFLILPVGISVGVVAAMSEHGHGSPYGAYLLIAALAVLGLFVILWIMLRLCLALPMSFAERRFALYESWGLTRGQSLRMFALYLVLIIGMISLELAVVAILVLPVLPHGPQPQLWQNLTAGGETGMWQRLGPQVAAFLVIAAFLGMALHAVLVAPLAVMYRDLSAAKAAAD